MKLHGSTEGNLVSAVRSANRFRGQPVHEDTVRFWSDLISHARDELASPATSASEAFSRLLADLEHEVARRVRSFDRADVQQVGI